MTHSLEICGDKKLKRKAEGCFEYISEVYALEVLRDAVPTAGVVRLYKDDALRRAYGDRRKVADAAIDYGDAWVVVEVTTSRPQRGTVSGQSEKAVSDDLDKLVEKASQIESTIAAIRTDETALTGASSPGHRHFHPVLVVTDGFPVNPISLTLLRERLAARGLLQNSDTGPLEVLDLEELEMIEQVHHAGGPSLRDLLAGKEASGVMGNVGLRDYMLLSLRLQPEQGRHIKDLTDKMMTLLRGRMGGLAA
jgi:hypothetical protein